MEPQPGISFADDPCRIVQRNHEDRNNDYKAAMAWDEKSPACIELVKDVLALANSGGGHLIIGVGETSTGFDFTGLTGDQPGTWDLTRLSNKVNAYADPAVRLTVQTATCDGRPFVLIRVMPFDSIPHICIKEYTKDGKRILSTGTFYVRTHGGETVPVQDAASMRSLVEQGVRALADEMLTSMRSILTGAVTTTSVDDRLHFEEQAAASLAEATTPYGGRYDAFITTQMFPSRFQVDRFSRGELKAAIDNAFDSQQGGRFFYCYGEGCSAKNDGYMAEYEWQTEYGKQRDHYLFWRLRQSGLAVHKLLLWEQPAFESTNGKLLSSDDVPRRVAYSMDGLVRLYTALGIADEDITWQMTITGSKGRKLWHPSVHWRGEYVSSENFIQLPPETHSIEEWRAGLVDLAAQVSHRILETFQWEGDNGERFKDIVRKYLDGQP
jgi:hypothetical protein